MRDDIQTKANVLRAELGVWLLILALCVVFLVVLGGCKADDTNKVLSTARIEYTNYDGGFSGGSNGGYGGSRFSGDTSGDSIGVSIAPLAFLYDESESTRGAIDKLYQLQETQAAEAKKVKAAEIPFVVEAPAPVVEPPKHELPWWQNATLMVGYATILGAIIAGIVKGWAMVKAKKEHA